MSSALERYRKRRFRKVILDGDEFTYRPLTKGEIRRVQAVKDDLKTSLSMAFLMLEDDASQMFSLADGETDEAFAERVAAELDDVQVEKIRDLALESAKGGKLPAMDKLVKNSDETTI